MSDAMRENNKLRTQQIGNTPATEMTKREQMALSILEGLLSKNTLDNDDFYVSKAVSLADLLIEKLNSNI